MTAVLFADCDGVSGFKSMSIYLSSILVCITYFLELEMKGRLTASEELSNHKSVFPSIKTMHLPNVGIHFICFRKLAWLSKRILMELGVEQTYL